MPYKDPEKRRAAARRNYKTPHIQAQKIAYRAAHKEESAAYDAARRLDPEQMENEKARNKKWIEENPIQYQETKNTWLERTRPERYLASCRQAGNPCTNTLEEVRWWFDNKPKECSLCKRTDCKLVLDHSHRDRGGDGRIRSWLCATCNIQNGYYENPEWHAKHEAYVKSFSTVCT